MDERKTEEAEFHNRLRDADLIDDPQAFKALTANLKYYAVAGSSMQDFRDRLGQHCKGKTVLDFGCGDGRYSIFLAKQGAKKVIGIDISDVSVEKCRREAEANGVSDRTDFRVMDCESLEFRDNTFDIVCEAGVLHHLDLGQAISEIARVTRPDGRLIGYEAVGHNPLFQLYRRLTPKLRTKYETEHILGTGDLRRMERYFERMDVRFFHLLSLLGVPFRNVPGFGPLLGLLEATDRVLLMVPGIRTLAWMMIFEMSGKRTPVVDTAGSPPQDRGE